MVIHIIVTIHCYIPFYNFQLVKMWNTVSTVILVPLKFKSDYFMNFSGGITRELEPPPHPCSYLCLYTMYVCITCSNCRKLFYISKTFMGRGLIQHRTAPFPKLLSPPLNLMRIDRTNFNCSGFQLLKFTCKMF